MSNLLQILLDQSQTPSPVSILNTITRNPLAQYSAVRSVEQGSSIEGGNRVLNSLDEVLFRYFLVEPCFEGRPIETHLEESHGTLVFMNGFRFRSRSRSSLQFVNNELALLQAILGNGTDESGLSAD
jgi:hypothetical protein